MEKDSFRYVCLMEVELFEVRNKVSGVESSMGEKKMDVEGA